MAQTSSEKAREKHADLSYMMRNLTDEEKEKYAMKTPSEKKKFKAAWELTRGRTKNLSGSVRSSSSNMKDETIDGTYMNLLAIAQAEGALVDRDEGLRIAKNYGRAT